MRVVIIDSGLDEENSAFKNKPRIVERIHIFEDENGQYLIDGDIRDNLGHGTSVCWIINKYVENIEFIIVKIFDDNIAVTEEMLIFSLDYIKNNIKCNVINISAGIGKCVNRRWMRMCCDELHKSGVYVVAAYSNDGALSYPAVFDSVIGVDISLSCFAPNQYQFIENSPINIRGMGYPQLLPDVNNKYVEKAGASFTAPHITGLICRALGQGYITNEEINYYLKENSSCRVEGKQRQKKEEKLAIKNAAIFPISKETKSLIEFSDMLPFKITHVCDIKYGKYIGRDVKELINGRDNLDNVMNKLSIEAIDKLDWEDSFDTLIIGHINMLGKAMRKKNIKNYLLEKCIQYKKQVYMYDIEEFNSAFFKEVKIRTPIIDSSKVPTNTYGKLYCSATPIIGVFGTSPKQGKFTLQLKLRNFLMERGYKVASLGTEPESELFGFEETYPIGYNATVSICGFEAITYLNSVISRIEDSEPDIIIVGSQSQTIPTGNVSISCLPMAQHELILGTQPDGYILCINSTDELEYIEKTISYLSIMTDAKVISLVIFPLIYRNVEGVLTEVIGKVDDKDMIRLKEVYTQHFGINTYSMDEVNLMMLLENNIKNLFTTQEDVL